MSSGTINDSDRRGTPTDGFTLRKPAENAGSQMPTGAAAGATPTQSGVGSTTSGLQVRSQLPQIVTKQTDNRALAGSFAGQDTRKSGDTARESLDAIRNADPIGTRFKAEPDGDDQEGIGG